MVDLQNFPSVLQQICGLLCHIKGNIIFILSYFLFPRFKNLKLVLLIFEVSHPKTQKPLKFKMDSSMNS